MQPNEIKSQCNRKVMQPQPYEIGFDATNNNTLENAIGCSFHSNNHTSPHNLFQQHISVQPECGIIFGQPFHHYALSRSRWSLKWAKVW